MKHAIIEDASVELLELFDEPGDSDRYHGHQNGRNLGFLF